MLALLATAGLVILGAEYPQLGSVVLVAAILLGVAWLIGRRGKRAATGWRGGRR